MAPTEYLAFIPLLIYGMAIANLLGEWKRLFSRDNWYFPYLIYTIVFTELAIYNVFIYVKLLDLIVGKPYLVYLGFILPPFLYIMMVNVFTPEKEDDTKEYFEKNMPVFLTLMAAFIASHFLFHFDESTTTIIGRIFSIVAVLITAYFRKKWMVYALTVMWLILLFSRFGQITT